MTNNIFLTYVEAMNWNSCNNSLNKCQKIVSSTGDGATIQVITSCVNRQYNSDMIAANNLINIFDYLMPIVTKKCPKEQIL